MSSSGVDVMQKKADDATVTWREYEALHDHLTGIMDRSTATIDGDIQAIQMKVDATEHIVNAMQTQVTDLQTSIQQLTMSVNGLRVCNVPIIIRPSTCMNLYMNSYLLSMLCHVIIYIMIISILTFASLFGLGFILSHALLWLLSLIGFQCHLPLFLLFLSGYITTSLLSLFYFFYFPNVTKLTCASLFLVLLNTTDP
jgi:hypothetical protein